MYKFCYGFDMIVMILNVKASKFPYSPGQEPNLPGNVDFLLQVCILDSLCSFLMILSLNFVYLLSDSL